MDLWVAENEENDEFLSDSMLNVTFSILADLLIDGELLLDIINADNALIVEKNTYLTGDVNFGNEKENDT